jgi:hypothetical protein
VPTITGLAFGGAGLRAAGEGEMSARIAGVAFFAAGFFAGEAAPFFDGVLDLGWLFIGRRRYQARAAMARDKCSAIRPGMEIRTAAQHPESSAVAMAAGGWISEGPHPG